MNTSFKPSTTACLIGVPTDIGAGHRGASMGPEALRVANIAQALQRRGLQVKDLGNLSGPVNPWLPPVEGHRHLKEVAEWNQTLYDATLSVLDQGDMPVMLGGDHCLAMGSIAAVADHCRKQGRKLRVIWLDAHADFNTGAVSPTGNVHGMPVACLCGHGPDELTNIGSNPSIQADDVRQIGIRSVDEQGEKRLVHEAGLEVYDMRYIDEKGMRQVMVEALEGIDDNTHIHVSFDVDFLDPSIAPGVGTTVPGGPTYREASLVMEMLADTGRVCSLDIVEVNPAYDDHNRTALMAVDLVESLFGKSTLVRRSP